VEYSQQARAKTAAILGFFWSSNDEVVFVTEAGLDIYLLTPQKKIIKVLFMHLLTNLLLVESYQVRHIGG
jgi:hypothetical protein